MTPRELLKELKIPFAEVGQSRHVTDGWVGVDCPSCSPGSQKFKLGLPLSSRPVLVCWTCGKLPLVRTLSILSGKQAGEVAGLLGDWTKLPLPEEKSSGVYQPPDGLRPLSELPLHRRYLVDDRGFDLEYLAGVWGVDQGIGLSRELAWRVFIPVLDRSGVPMSWTTRAIGDGADRRYIMADPEQEVVPAKKLLYGAQHVKHGAIVVEGPTDAWRVGPGAVALMGTAFTKAQVAKLAKVPVRVVAFDREPLAQEAADKLCELLGPLPGRTVRVELEASDPGVATAKEIRRLRRRYLG